MHEIRKMAFHQVTKVIVRSNRQSQGNQNGGELSAFDQEKS